MRQEGPNLVDNESFANVALTDTTPLETFVTSTLWGRFPSLEPNGFASAAATGSGEIGVGVGGLDLIASPASFADASTLFSVTNTGTEPADVRFSFTIPRMLVRGLNIDIATLPAYPTARAAVSLDLDLTEPMGVVYENRRVLELVMELEMLSNGYFVTQSDDLRELLGGGVQGACTRCEVTGDGRTVNVSVPEFSAEIFLGTLAAGAVLEFDYTFAVTVTNPTRMGEGLVGMQAFIGDPFR